MESAAHCLFECKLVRKMWEVSLFGIIIASLRGRTVLEIFRSLADQLDHDAFCLFCMTVWVVWENRNARINGGRVKSLEMVANGASQRLEEFWKSNQAIKVSPPKSLLCP